MKWITRPKMHRTAILGLAAFSLLFALGGQSGMPATAHEASKKSETATAESSALPLVREYCFECHSTAVKKSGLDLQRFAAPADLRKDIKPWEDVIERLEAGDMPPLGKPRPTAAEKQRLIAWIHGVLDSEVRIKAGDPGYVPMRRLSNAEYNYTIRDLTGVDLQPAREFPADGAAGEGFTNAAEALTDISPALLSKYFNAAKDIADHAVLLPDGFRLSTTKTRRDWTNESTARLREFLAAYSDAEGRLPFQPYLLATVRYRTEISSGKTAIEQVAGKEKLNAKYLRILWGTLNDDTPSYPLSMIRAHWRQAKETDLKSLAAENTAWQNALWKVVKVGSYVYPLGKGFAESTSRQIANNPSPADAQTLRLAVKPLPGQSETVLFLSARELNPVDPDSAKGEPAIIWQKPRLEAAGKQPLLLRDYAEFGRSYEIDYGFVFSKTSQYLAAAVEIANHRAPSVEALAKRQGLDPAMLQRWAEVLAVEPLDRKQSSEGAGRVVPAVPLGLLEEKVAKDNGRPAISGWRQKGSDLPILLSNNSSTLMYIPGKAPPHGVAVHPTPTEFVAVAWKSPMDGSVRIRATVTHAHPACGNGVAWWLEHRHGQRATMFAEGALELGGEAKYPEKPRNVHKGDLILLAIDAKNGDHSCDLTDIALTITQADSPGKVWDLASDVADNVLDGNPHADKFGNLQTWSFVKGSTRPVIAASATAIPPESLLGRWSVAASTLGHQSDGDQLALQTQTLLSGPRPADEKDPNRILYDRLVSADSPLFQGVDLSLWAKPWPGAVACGLAKDRFGRQGSTAADDASLAAAANSVTEVRLPAALLRDYEFVVEGKLADEAGDRVVLFNVQTTRPAADPLWDGKSPVVTSPGGKAFQDLTRGFTEFRNCFPLYLSFPQVIPNDEEVSLKMFHREDGPLARLLLDDTEARRLDHLWAEQRFIGQQPIAEKNYLPTFIGFVTQDQSKEMLAYFEGLRPVFRARADAFEQEERAAVPKQLQALLDFASHAFRRPLAEKEKTELLNLHQSVLRRGAEHDEAFRAVLTRILVSPAFLFRVEEAPPGSAPGPVSDWDLATRLSYFLWASAPDAELRKLAAAGRLHEPQVLSQQAERMLKDSRIRALAIEFGAQWLHVRGFDELNEKNEKLFPTFNASLRGAIYEETLRFFQDLFQSDRSVWNLVDADYTFLNEELAKHYGIPEVSGPQWRRVTGVQQYGRGGVLGLASIQAVESGASRTSPILRGNWVVETLLGEKLPRPPPNVPRLPEEEGTDGLTMRQQVEKHTHSAQCAVCHQRIDPVGFALENYDPIGRYRRKDSGGLSIDAKTKLADGTELEGIAGLRSYLLTRKKDVFVRLFCRRLLGYALGRSVTLSDEPLVTGMVSELDKNTGRISAAVQEIVQSPQFRMIRGRDFVADK